MSDAERLAHLIGRTCCLTGLLAVVLASGVDALPLESCTDTASKASDSNVVSSLLQSKALEGRGAEKMSERDEVIESLAETDNEMITPKESRYERGGSLTQKAGHNLFEMRENLASDAYVANRLNDIIPDDCTVNFSKARHQKHLSNSWRESSTIGGMLDSKPSNMTQSLRYDRCAVVGSGGSLHGRHLGAEIDAHDAVFRMGKHEVHGWEDDVGRHTTFRLLYPESSDLLRHGGEIPDLAVFVPYKNADRYWYSCLRAGRKDPCNCLWAQGIKLDFWLRKVACRNDLEVGKLAMVSQLFLQLQEKVYHGAGLGRKPSSGFTTVTMALATCKAVDVYGFGSVPGRCKYDAPGGCKSKWQYSNCQLSVHDFSGEHGYYHALQEAGMINLRTDTLQNKS